MAGIWNGMGWDGMIPLFCLLSIVNILVPVQIVGRGWGWGMLLIILYTVYESISFDYNVFGVFRICLTFPRDASMQYYQSCT